MDESRRNGLESRIGRVLVSDWVVGMSSQAELDHLNLQGEMFTARRGRTSAWGRVRDCSATPRT